MAGKKGPIPGVIESNGRYYRNLREGGRKRWVPLTRVDEGRPALLRAMADLEDKPPPAVDASIRMLLLSRVTADNIRYDKFS